MNGRRASRGAGLTLVLALALPATGCQAYHSAYWSFPLNSMQMVENASVYEWSYGGSLGMEFLYNLFPYYWLLTFLDVAILPVTLIHDAAAAFAHDRSGQWFPEQVEVERKRHPHRRKKGLAADTPTPVPTPGPQSGFESR